MYSTGFAVPRIKDRFQWTLLPEVIAGRGGPPGHSTNDQPDLVTNTAERDGSIEQSTALSVFLAERGVPGPRRHRPRAHAGAPQAAIGAPSSLAPPPEGMKWLKAYADRPDNRSLYPFNTFRGSGTVSRIERWAREGLGGRPVAGRVASRPSRNGACGICPTYDGEPSRSLSRAGLPVAA